MRAYLLVAVLVVASSAAFANEAFISQSPAVEAIGQGAHAVAAASIAVPLSPAAFQATTGMSASSASNLSSNSSSITQQGTKNLAVVSQSGGLNQSIINQSGSANQATVTQRR
ncbi:curlin repeat-containing protein [Bradyrhizobium sp. HKCCYLS1011]|uniref:curlin repeat-containing protein n=1 Tax=Bradyrhizobium sp. HKCCYLS1011 TaxID=3420733 RepID=UPI003EBE42BD